MQKQTEQIVQLLMLDNASAAKFTQVYGNYLKELYTCRAVNGKKLALYLTDEEVEKQIKEHLAQIRRMLDVREKYYLEFRKLFSPKQVAKIYKAER